MRIERDGHTLTYESDIIEIIGKFSIMPEEYGEIEDLFEEIIDTNPADLTPDIKNPEYLNSSGIKTNCLLPKAADIDGLKMKVLYSDRYTWQRETVPTFEELMDNMEIVFE